jgi:hypothetical protein
MSGLRAALERALGSLPVMTHDTVPRSDRGYRTQALPKAQLLDMLAAHPEEPISVVSRERVAEVLYQGMVGQAFLQHPEPQRTRFTRQIASLQVDALLAAGVFRDEATS